MTAFAVMYFEVCKRSTLYNNAFDHQLDIHAESDIPAESETPIGWIHEPQTDFVHGNQRPEDWVSGNIIEWTRP